MPIDSEEFDVLKSDIHEIVDKQLKGCKVKENPTGSWSCFAQIEPRTNEYLRNVVCATELLEEHGYVTSIRQVDPKMAHRNIYINVHMTYDVHNRVINND